MRVAAIGLWLKPAIRSDGLDLFVWHGPALHNVGRRLFCLFLGSDNLLTELGLVLGHACIPCHAIRQRQGKARPHLAMCTTLIARRTDNETRQCVPGLDSYVASPARPHVPAEPLP